MSCQLSQIDSTDILITRNDSRTRPTDRKSPPLKSRGCIGSNRFKKILTCANQGPNHAFGSGLTLDFEPNFGPVRKSSGSNLGSEPDCGSTRRMVFLTSQSFILTPFSVQLTLSQYMIQNPYPH